MSKYNENDRESPENKGILVCQKFRVEFSSIRMASCCNMPL
mgnify:CR=1 FL=1